MYKLWIFNATKSRCVRAGVIRSEQQIVIARFQKRWWKTTASTTTVTRTKLNNVAPMNYMDTNKLNPIIIIVHLSWFDSFYYEQIPARMQSIKARAHCVVCVMNNLLKASKQKQSSMSGTCRETNMKKKPTNTNTQENNNKITSCQQQQKHQQKFQAITRSSSWLME